MGELVCDLDASLEPNEVRGTRPISMASLNLRFIIFGGRGPQETSRSAYCNSIQLSLVL